MESADRRDRRWCLAAALARHEADDAAALRLAGDLAAFLDNGTQFGPLLGVENPARGTVCAEKHTVPLSPPMAETLAALRSLDRGEGARACDIVAAADAGEITRSRLTRLKSLGLAEVRGRAKNARWFATSAGVRALPDAPDAPAAPLVQAMRKCLGGCGRDFLSAGKGNRICPGCTVKNSKRAGGVDDAAGVII
jgi:hypothetical protein